MWMGDCEPFGKLAANASNNIEILSHFSGQYLDPETGLYYNYFRDYDPSIGRYIESDPIGLQGGINTYGYALQNPLSNTDAKGLNVCTYKTDQGYKHKWVEIGGDKERSYGWWPSGSAWGGDPGQVLTPDPRAGLRDSPKTEESCVDSTEEEDKKIEDWIKNNYSVNPTLENTNEDYDIIFNNCYDFVDDVNNQLNEIKKKR